MVPRPLQNLGGNSYKKQSLASTLVHALDLPYRPLVYDSKTTLEGLDP